MEQATITFIGGGNMAASLVGGLIADGWSADRIHVAEPDAQRRESLRSRFSVHTEPDNADAAGKGNVVVLAVKPQALPEVARDLAGVVGQHRPLVISIAAGVRAVDLSAWLGGEAALVRAMPNTPALVRTGATALYANARTSDNQRELAETILRAVGLTVWVEDEAHMDVITALSGSGPAYFFLVMEALENAARGLGLPAEQSRLLTLQTALGAAKMALESTEGPEILRQRVTSPGGTTERALQSLEQGGLRQLFEDALAAAAERSRELAAEMGER